MTEYVEVEFTAGCPEFMGTDLESYGPFEEGDQAKIPQDNAEILVNRGQAEKPGDDEQESENQLWP